MRLIKTPADPNFKLYTRSPSVDFIKLFSKTFEKLPIDVTRLKWRPVTCSFGSGMQATIQTPSVKDIERVLKAIPDARVIGIEVSLDFRPKGHWTLAEGACRREEMRCWILAHL